MNSDKRIRRTRIILSCCIAVLLCGCTAKTADGLDEIVLAQAAGSAAEEAPGGPENGSDTGVQQAQTASDSAAAAGNPAESAAGETAEIGAPCYVHICGAVREPGVYRMAEGDRIFAVIEKAGGFVEDACEDYVNQAQAVADGLKIWIPTMREADAESSAQSRQGGRYGAGEQAGLEYPRTSGISETPASESALVDINTATQEQLCSLPGIGKAKAQAVIAYRSEHGDFARTEDIMKVSGIGQSNYEKIKAHITAAR